MSSQSLLRIEDLRVSFCINGAEWAAVDGVNLEVDRGRVVALVGESGCGKTLTALAVLRLTPESARVSGRIWYHGPSPTEDHNRDLLALSEAELRRVRGGKISMIFQEPLTCLNPLYRVGDQVAETLRVHLGCGRREAWARSVELLAGVGIPSPGQRARDYPHQLSGGTRQRVMIAMAIACGPELLIADEPTTALDVSIQAQVLELMLRLHRERGMGLLLITHDLGVVARVAHQVAVMYAGQIVEWGNTRDLLLRPTHPYTQGLLASVPSIRRPARLLPGIEGTVPRLGEKLVGCRFRPRCPAATGGCEAEQALLELSSGQTARCWRAGQGVIAFAGTARPQDNHGNG